MTVRALLPWCVQSVPAAVEERVWEEATERAKRDMRVLIARLRQEWDEEMRVGASLFPHAKGVSPAC
jgi:hypothetical protein